MITLHGYILKTLQYSYSMPVFLNRGYTYHLGVRGAKAGGTKHQSLQGYTLWKFKPDFTEHSSWFSVVWRTIIHSLGLVRYTLWILYLACLHKPKNGICVKNNTIIYVARASNSKRDCDVKPLLIFTFERLNMMTSVREKRLRAWSLLLLAATVRRFAHIPLEIFDIATV